jgi:hypothetical protein
MLEIWNFQVPFILVGDKGNGSWNPHQYYEALRQSLKLASCPTPLVYINFQLYHLIIYNFIFSANAAMC